MWYRVKNQKRAYVKNSHIFDDWLLVSVKLAAISSRITTVISKRLILIIIPNLSTSGWNPLLTENVLGKWFFFWIPTKLAKQCVQMCWIYFGNFCLVYLTLNLLGNVAIWHQLFNSLPLSTFKVFLVSWVIKFFRHKRFYFFLFNCNYDKSNIINQGIAEISPTLLKKNIINIRFFIKTTIKLYKIFYHKNRIIHILLRSHIQSEKEIHFLVYHRLKQFM